MGYFPSSLRMAGGTGASNHSTSSCFGLVLGSVCGFVNPPQPSSSWHRGLHYCSSRGSCFGLLRLRLWPHRRAVASQAVLDLSSCLVLIFISIYITHNFPELVFFLHPIIRMLRDLLLGCSLTKSKSGHDPGLRIQQIKLPLIWESDNAHLFPCQKTLQSNDGRRTEYEVSLDPLRL